MVREMPDLLMKHELPAGFTYPRTFLRAVELGLTNLEPWWIIQGGLLRRRNEALRNRYPNRSLVLFAVREDNDDVACWDLQAENVSVIHDFASPGYEQRAVYESFNAWLRQAIEDFIDFE
jgi:hypothetical protein